VTANPADPAGNMVSVSRTGAEVLAGAGSRYVSSSPLSDIDRLLDEPGAFVFIGKPCDVSALRQLGKVDPRVDAKVPLMLAFFCAGIPSRAAVGRVLAALEVEPQELAAFRYRGNGWPGKAAAEARDGRVAEMTYEASWGGFLSHEVQFRCKICPDAVGGVADIACADAWYGGESGYPSFEEMEGRSLIVARTARGQEILNGARAGGRLATEPLDIGEIDLMQPSQARRKRLILARAAAVRILGRPVPKMAGLMVAEAARRAPAREALRNFLGTVRRAFSGKLSRR
jgi:coenzyme F420 hydrogenase subunit beta